MAGFQAAPVGAVEVEHDSKNYGVPDLMLKGWVCNGEPTVSPLQYAAENVEKRVTQNYFELMIIRLS